MKNEVMDNMEYLMQELHREWARSGPSPDFLYTAEHRGQRGTGSAGKAGGRATALIGAGGFNIPKERPASADELHPASAGEKDEDGAGTEK